MYSSTKEQQRAALEWIVSAAERHAVPYQITGGLAVRAYGGTRPLHDIDLYMPFSVPGWESFLAEAMPHVTWGPLRVVEGAWDLTYVKINYGGQKIEIGDSADLKIRDCATGAWHLKTIRFEASVSRSVLGCEVAVMPADQLIAYKLILGREVDLRDIRDLTSLGF